MIGVGKEIHGGLAIEQHKVGVDRMAFVRVILQKDGFIEFSKDNDTLFIARVRCIIHPRRGMDLSRVFFKVGANTE
jgi:hypothetical protein